MIYSKIRVLLLAALPPPPGGDSTWAEEYIRYNNKHNFSIDVINTAIIGKRSENVNDSFYIFDEIKRSFQIWKGLFKSIKHFKPNVVHMNSNCSSKGLIRDYISSCIVRINKIPLVVHCHTNVGFKIKGSKLGNYFLKKLLNNTKTVIVLNQKSYEYVVSRVKTSIEIIPNFITNSYIVQDEKEINDDIKNVVFIGHVKKEKGINEILTVARKLTKITFYIVGPVTEDYIKYIPEQNVKIIGAVSPKEVKEFLIKCDVFLFPTYSEGFSVALLEAMANGIPIIATNVGANNDMLEGKGGVIVEPKNVDEIILAFNKMSSKSIRQEMSKWNINKVRSYYTIDIIMEQLINLYLKVINNKQE